MPTRILTPFSTRAVADQLGAQVWQPVLGDEVYGVQDIGDFAGRSPFANRRLLGQATISGAVAANYSGALILPGPGTVFVLEEFYIHSGAAKFVDFRIMRPVDVAAITVVGSIPLGVLNRPLAGTGFVPVSGATLSAVRHTALVGGIFGRWRCAANGASGPRWPHGIVLDGTAPNPLGVMVVNTTLNDNLEAGVYGAEYDYYPALTR